MKRKNGIIYEEPTKAEKVFESFMFPFLQIVAWIMAICLSLLTIASIVLGVVWADPKFIISGVFYLITNPLLYMSAYILHSELREVKKIDKETELLQMDADEE